MAGQRRRAGAHGRAGLPASALSGHAGSSAGGHLYVGLGLGRRKKRSIGLKGGHNRGRTDGLLALIDINGDGLPDKVFRDGGQISYRPNRAGPRADASTSFGAKQAVANLPAIARERTSMTSAGPEAYFGIGFIGAFVGANISVTDAESPVYFSDVNGDGLIDLVNNGTVLFNRIDAAGHPVFTADSSQTPYPVGPGAVEAGLIADELEDIYQRQLAANPKIDTLRRWIAPYGGTVAITAPVALIEDTSDERAEYETADGVRVAIQLGASELWATQIAADDYVPKDPTGVSGIAVERGDILYFRVQSIDDGAFDRVSWAPQVLYTGVPAAVDADGLDPYRFDSAADWTLLASRPGAVAMPFNGTVSVTGTLIKSGPTSDDATLEVLKNGAVIASRAIPAADTGSFTLNSSLSVLRDEFDADGNPTQDADELAIRLSIDSRVDITRFTWNPAAPPRIAYTASPDVDPDAALPVLDVPVSADLYPVSDLDAPLAPFTAATAGVHQFEAELQGATGSAVLTAKSNGALIAKQAIAVGATQSFALTLEAGQAVFFEFHTDHATATGITLRQVRRVTGDEEPGSGVASALYYASEQTVLPQSHRGWTAFGYEADGSAANQPVVITRNDLTLESLGAVDRDGFTGALKDAIRNGEDATDLGAPFEITLRPYVPDYARDRLQGPDEDLWASAGEASASRQGDNFIAAPTADTFAGGRAVPRLSVTRERAVAGGPDLNIDGLGIGGSVSFAASTSRALLDFKDINGDLFPDVVASGLEVQFSPAVGGLEGARVAVGVGGNAQRTQGSAFSFGVGGNYARSVGNSRSDHDQRTGNPPAPDGNTHQQMATIGVSAKISDGESDVAYDLIDINGDGLVDRVSADGGTLRVQLGLGYSFAAEEVWDTGKVGEGENNAETFGGTIGFNDGVYGFGGGINTSASRSGSLASLQDLNGDGLLDRVRVDARDASAITVAFNTGNGFTGDITWPGAAGAGLANARTETQGGGGYITLSFCPAIFGGPCVIINPGGDFARTMARAESTITDIDGDGFADHLTSTSDDAVSVGRNPTGRTNLLRGVTRPLGAAFEVAYERTGNSYDQPQNRFVMSRLVIDDGHEGDGVDTQIRSFAYEDGVYERRERQFYGFRRCIETHRDPAAGEAPYRIITRLYKNDTYYLSGLLEKETLADADGNPFTETENTYEVRDEETGAPLADLADLTAVAFPQLIRTDQSWFEGQPQAGKTTFQTFAYDQYGNVIATFDAGDVGSSDDVTAAIGYFEDVPNYIVGKANAITVTGNGVEQRRRAAVFQPGTGNLLEVSRFLADGTAATTTLTYDAFGNVAAITGPVNHAGQRYQRLYAYDPVVNTYPASVTDSFGYTSTAEYDLRFGRPTRTVDINGQEIVTQYDAKGRMATVAGPYELAAGLTTIEMEYHPEAVIPWALTRHVDVDRDVSDFIETATFIDGLKRVTQTKKDHTLHTGGGATTEVMAVSGRVVYDGFGRAVEQFYPVTEPLGTAGIFNAAFDAVTPTRTTHDVLDRPLSVANPANETMRFAYDFGADRAGVRQFRTTLTDANGIPRELFRDVDNDITAVKLINEGGAQLLWTSYGYDPLDQIVAVTDHAGNVTTAVYDNFGRRVAIDSPDAGLTALTFDPASNLRTKTTANLRAAGQTVTYSYDFNRLVLIDYPQFPENNVAYTYGDPGAEFNRAGRVVTVTAEGGTTERFYGPLGEVVKEVKTVAAETGSQTVFTTEFRFDAWNRLKVLTFNDGEVVTFAYNAGGQVERITGEENDDPYVYLDFLGYDKFAARERVVHGNGATTDYAYNPLNRRLSGLLAQTAASRVFMDMSYTYDAVGNILALSNAAPLPNPPLHGGPASFAFAYDDLYQLRTATGEFASPPNKQDGFTLSMSYDGIHNITAKTQRAWRVTGGGKENEDKGLTYDWAYDYGSSRPHAPTHIGERTYLYDLNGNQAGWDHDQNGTRRRILWDEDNRMQQVADNGRTTTFKYDDDTTRVVKRGPGGETLYVNRWYVAGPGRNSKHVFAGTTRIATKLDWQHRADRADYKPVLRGNCAQLPVSVVHSPCPRRPPFHSSQSRKLAPKSPVTTPTGSWADARACWAIRSEPSMRRLIGADRKATKATGPAAVVAKATMATAQAISASRVRPTRLPRARAVSSPSCTTARARPVSSAQR